MKLVLVLVLGFASSAWAACGNQCNGHGRCTNYKMAAKTASHTSMSIELYDADSTYNALGYDVTVTKKDTCTCFTRMGRHGKTVYAYADADCSARTCPHGKEHGSVDIASRGTTVDRYYAECSNRGTCDTKTGECSCEAGYEGAACERSCCGGDCAATPCLGRGRCMFLQDIVEDTKDIATAGNTNFDPATGEGATYYQLTTYLTLSYTAAWDAQKIMGCWCDPGYRGSNCEEKECPSQADPMLGPGSEFGRACSGRGSCEEGECTCHKGYYGSACEHATNLWS